MLEKFVLDLIDSSENFKLYFLHDPKTILGSTYIAFSKGRIIVFGDFTPSLYGNVSAANYGEDWFAGELNEDYLCEKFLQKNWHKEHAINYFQDDSNLEYLFGENCVDKQTKAIVENIILELDDGEMREQELYDRLRDEGVVLDDGIPGIGYNPNEAKILCMIQKKFSELVKASRKEKCLI